MEIRADMDVKSDRDLYVGKAFITFEKQSQASRLIKKFKMHTSLKVFFFIIYRIFRCKENKLEKRYWEGKRVIVERASEPGDVYWENLSISSTQRFIKSLVTYSLTFILLAIVFGIYYALALLKQYFEDKVEKDSTDNGSGESSSNLWIIRLISIGTSIFAVIINSVLNWLIRMMSSYEKHSTYTKYHLSVATKLMMATFVNIALLPLFTKLDKEDWFDNGGLATAIFFNVISVSFVSPLLKFFNIMYFIKRFRAWKEHRKGNKSKLTQRQANKLFEAPKMDMATSYAQTGLLFLLVCLYTPIQPILPIIALIGVFIQYWVEKYLLLRRCGIPEAMGANMAKFYAGLIPYGMLLYAISNYVFLRDLSDNKNTHGQWSLWFTLAYVILPVRMVTSLFTDTVSRDDKFSYSGERFAFIQDFDRSNPMTSTFAKAQ